MSGGLLVIVFTLPKIVPIPMSVPVNSFILASSRPIFVFLLMLLTLQSIVHIKVKLINLMCLYQILEYSEQLPLNKGIILPGKDQLLRISSALSGDHEELREPIPIGRTRGQRRRTQHYIRTGTLPARCARHCLVGLPYMDFCRTASVQYRYQDV